MGVRIPPITKGFPAGVPGHVGNTGRMTMTMTMMSMLQMEEIFGGLSTDREGLPVPAIMGRLCLWRSPRAAATFATYKDFKSSMAVSCQETGEPGVLRFTPDYDMPSVMYYQVRGEKI